MAAQERLAPAQAMTDSPHLPVGSGERLDLLHSRVHVADQAVVRHPAGGPEAAERVVGAGTFSLAAVQVAA